MAENTDHEDIDRNGLTIIDNRACYTSQGIEKIPKGLSKLIDKKKCTCLNLSFNNLESINGLKDFLFIQELMLDNNNLKNLQNLPILPNLTIFSLNNNKIRDIDKALEKIGESCPIIRYVSLLGNPGCPDQLTKETDKYDDDDYERYFLFAIHILPKTLKFLDSRTITNNERLLAKNKGKFLKTIKFDDISYDNSGVKKGFFDETDFYVNYTPLPETPRSQVDFKSAFGKTKYRYLGKNSEGNRFIRNKDL